jgi:hypothetical protein
MIDAQVFRTVPFATTDNLPIDDLQILRQNSLFHCYAD